MIVFSASSCASGGSVGRDARRIVQVVRGDDSSSAADHANAIGLRSAGEMRHAAGTVMHHRAAQLLKRDILVRDGLENIRAGDKHIAVSVRP